MRLFVPICDLGLRGVPQDALEWWLAFLAGHMGWLIEAKPVILFVSA